MVDINRDRVYCIWKHMKDRCYNPNFKHYGHYGGRGITVCDEWRKDFNSFYEWAISNGYDDSLTLDRKDVNGNYDPTNCRWATRREQMLNTRRNHYLTYDGETLTVNEWAEKLGMKQNTLLCRIRRGWSVERALTTRV